MNTGIKHEEKMTVSINDTAKVHGSGTLDVFATPAMAALMEKTCMNCVSPYLEDGQTTVGTLLEIKHVSASPVGAEIRCECELIEIDRKRLVFVVKAFDNAGEIGNGKHERFIVDKEKFMIKTQSKF